MFDSADAISTPYRAAPTSARACTTSGTAGSSGMALDPNFCDPARTCTRSTRTTRTRARPSSRAGPDSCPDARPGATARRLRDRRSPVALQRRRRRAGPGRGLVQQYPSHRFGGIVFGADGASTWPPAMAPTSASRTTARRQPGEPVRRPTRRCRGTTPPTAEGGALRARTCARLETPPASTARSCGSPRDRRRRCRQPERRQRRTRTSGGSSPTGCATRSGSRFARDQRTVGGRRRLERLGGDQSDRRRRPAALENFGWPCYEGVGRQAGYDSTTSPCARACTRRARGGHRPVVRLQPREQGRRQRHLPDRQLVDLRPCVLRPAARSRPRTVVACSSPTTAATASGSCAKGSNGLPDPATRQTFVAGAVGPVDLVIGPTATCSTSTSTAERSDGSEPDRNPGADARIVADADDGASPVDRGLRRHELDRSGRTALTYAWDLDGDGAVDDSTAAAPDLAYTQPEAVTVRLTVTNTSAATGTTTQVINVAAAANEPPVPTILTPDRHDMGGRRHDRLQRERHRPRGWGPRRVAPLVAGGHAPLPLELPHA